MTPPQEKLEVSSHESHVAVRDVESWVLRAAKGMLLFLAISPVCFAVDLLFVVLRANAAVTGSVANKATQAYLDSSNR